MTQRRWGALDAARGLAVVAMIVFHSIWDLSYFGYAPATLPWSAPMRLFGHSIAFAFLFVAGVALTLAHRDCIRWRAFWRRFAIVAGAAALVTIGTYVVFPSAYVFFGILHCIAAASLLALPFLRAPWPLALVAAVFFLAGPELFASPAFNSNWLQWLGLSTSEPMTQDWRPLFPWTGALLLGVAVGRAILSHGEKAGAGGEGVLPQAPRLVATSAERGWLFFLGRHSLIIYLAHQPLLFALFTALVALAPPPIDTADFVASCEARCVEAGGKRKICYDGCLCTALEAVRSKALEGVTDEKERGRRLDEIAQRCVDRYSKP
ncbi:heparan-alpha-glucosaminide N-acetyltransferase [Methylocystis sp. 9N]|uniref:Heparan-alpha-glucosaminide N-acetyltransferase n=1 Tax=Methylocystis borbori TaxID=3118750 RepID=A0ABU7XFF6_9HYPH